VPPPTTLSFPLAKPACASDAGSMCHSVWNATHTDWLASAADTLLVPAIHILLIVVIAAVLRSVAHRVIRRLVRSTGQGSVPAALRPLKETVLVGRVADVAARLAERRRQRAETIGSVLRSIVSFTIFSIAFILVLGEVGIDLRPIIASAGIAGIAIGFGAQNLVKDFLAGMFMILEDQYGVGDSVDLGHASGVVEAVGLRATRLRDLNGTVWYVRNGEVLRVGNKAQGSAAVVLDIRTAADADIGIVNQAVADAVYDLAHHETLGAAVLRPPDVDEIGRSEPPGDAEPGVTVRITVQTRAGDQRRIEQELRDRLADRFDAAGISSPDLPVPDRGQPESAAGPTGSSS
jgi:moderate conductance mechanosensitive channel